MTTVASARTSIVRGKFLVAEIDDLRAPRIIPDGALLVKDGRIAEIGPFRSLNDSLPNVQVVGSDQHVVVPGFVNGHHHVGLTPFQLGSPDLPLELWILRRIGGRDVDPYLDTLYSAFEMIESGVTTVQHIQMRSRGSQETTYKASKSILKAYADIGMRVSYSLGMRDQNRLVYEADDTFLNQLPEVLSEQLARQLQELSLPLESAFDIFKTLLSESANSPRCRIQLAPANLHWCSDRALDQFADWAQSYDVPLHMHLLETPIQHEYARMRTGTTAVTHLDRFGLLSDRLTLGHGVWLSEGDIELVAERGTHICHNCSSNFRLRSGIAPLPKLLEYGIGVAIGIDEAGINDDRDMLQEMRLVARTHRTPNADVHVPHSTEIFRMATEDGANTTAFSNDLGTLKVGKAADFTLLRWDRICFPYLDTSVGVVDAIVNRAKSSDVDIVVVDGEVIFEAGKFTHVSKEDVLEEIRKSLSGPLSATEQERQLLAQALTQHVVQFYEQRFGIRIATH